MAKQYIVKSDGAGAFVKGELITEEQAGLWFKKWLGNGGIAEASAEEVKAAGGMDPASPALATGDIDAVSKPPEQPNKGAGK